MADPATTEPSNPSPESAPDFDKRHQEDLGVKRFTLTQGKLVAIPLLTMGLGGLIGYHTLGKPLTKMFPRFFQGVDTTKEAIETIRDMATGTEGKKWNLQAAKWIGAGILGTVGSLLGSVFVGYDKWRKDETTRLAAEEIERDISKMELFRPSDPEMVAENKRLRGMLAEAGAHQPPHALADGAHEGKPKHHGENPSHQVGSSEYHGKHQQHEQQIA